MALKCKISFGKLNCIFYNNYSPFLNTSNCNDSFISLPNQFQIILSFSALVALQYVGDFILSFSTLITLYYVGDFFLWRVQKGLDRSRRDQKRLGGSRGVQNGLKGFKRVQKGLGGSNRVQKIPESPIDYHVLFQHLKIVYIYMYIIC